MMALNDDFIEARNSYVHREEERHVGFDWEMTSSTIMYCRHSSRPKDRAQADGLPWK